MLLIHHFDNYLLMVLWPLGTSLQTTVTYVVPCYWYWMYLLLLLLLFSLTSVLLLLLLFSLTSVLLLLLLFSINYHYLLLLNIIIYVIIQ